MDQLALENVYRQHRQGLFTLALTITGCRAHAEDAVHDAFSRLTRRASIRGELVPYVFSAVRNAAYDIRRSQKRNGHPTESIFDGFQPPESSPWTSAEQLILNEERDQLLRLAIERLPDEYREAVVLKTYSQLTFREIAEVTGQPMKTIATRYRRALDKLSEELKEKL